MRSKFTLEPLPTAEEIFKDMVQLYLDERGYGDLFDVYKVLLPIRPEEIGIQLFSVIEDRNEKEMLSEGYCPECGGQLTNHHVPATREDPAEDYPECSDCKDSYRRRVS